MINAFIYSPPGMPERLNQGEQLSFMKHTAKIEYHLRGLDKQIQGQNKESECSRAYARESYCANCDEAERV